MCTHKGRRVVQGGRVLTMDRSLGDFDRADILIEDGFIRRIAPSLSGTGDAEILDARNCIVLPGFVDCHRHMWQTQLRCATADWSLFDYSARIRSVYASFYSAEDAWLGCYAGFLEALNAGVTTIVDHAHIMNSPDHADQVVRAFWESGIRGILCYGLFGNPAPEDEVTIRKFMPPDWHFEDACRVREAHLGSDDARVTFGVAMTETEFFPLEFAAREITFARRLGARRISAHAGMGAMSRHTRFVERLASAGLLGPDLLFIHGWSLTDRELGLLARNGAAVVSTPETELQMGMGFPVAARALAAGGLAALGIDIVSNQSADMFTQMRLALQVQRALENEELGRRGRMPERIRLRARDVLELATIGGARAIGMDHRTGSLSPGKEADLVLVRADSPNMVPVNDPVGSLVLGANVADVDTVLVGGEALKRNGKLTGADWPALADKLVQSRDRIVEAARKKGFEQGERVMARHVFPLDRKSALRSRATGLFLRLSVPFLHRALFDAIVR